MAKKVDRFREIVKSHWHIDGLVGDLCDAAWRETEPNRYDRMLGIGSWDSILELAERAVDDEAEWRKAQKEGYEPEYVDQYLDTLASIVSEKGKCVQTRIPEGKKEWRPGAKMVVKKIGHVYGTYEDDECYLGQYEEGVTAEELEARGFKVED